MIEPTIILPNIIQTLEMIRNRPLMYIKGDVDELRAILLGFNLACGSLGLASGFDSTYQAVVRDRGWTWLPSAGIVPVLIEAGMDTPQIINELLTIEIEVWKKRLLPV